MSQPRSWAEAHERFARTVASGEAAAEWTRQALEAVWGVPDPADLERSRRALGLQKLAGVVLTLEDAPHDLAFDPAQRAVVAATIQTYFGVAVEGPEWRLAATETNRLTEWEAAPDFASEAPQDAQERLEQILAAAAQAYAVRAEKGRALPPSGIGEDGV